MKTFKQFNTDLEEAYGDYDDDRAMAAQKAQMPASLGGKHKDRSANKSSTQVIKQKSQYHAKEETEVNEISDRLAKRAINKAHAASRSADSRGDKKLSRKRANQRDNMTDMLADKQDRREYENPGKGKYKRDTVAQMGRHYEEVSKTVSKLNQVLENRRLQKSGAGEEGTDEVVKKYKKDTPGQIEEGNVEMQNNDAFRRMEGLVEYLMGLSIDDPGKFTVHPIPETNGYRLEYANGGLATVTEADWKNHFGNVSGEDFIELCKEFGMNVTTSGTEVIDPAPSQVDGVTESEQVDITKNSATSTPETVAADYADRYRMDNIVKLISKQIRGK